MHNLFLTGEKGIGKSTIIKDIIERINISIGGYITERSVQGDIDTFTTKSLNDLVEENVIANVNTRDKTKEIFTDSFEIGLKSVLHNSLKNRDLIVMDELGVMENDLRIFKSKVYEILDSNKPVLGVLKDCDCQFLNQIRDRRDVRVVRITRENRDTILDEIVQILKTFGISFKSKGSFKWSQKRIDWYNEALDHEKSEYPKSFLEEIGKYTGPLKDKTVLDIGAGTGAFAIPLMEEGAYITAVDSSFNMLNSLSERAKDRELNRFKCIVGPFEKVQVKKYNIAISAFSGGGTKTLEGIKKMHDAVKDYAFIISSFGKQENNFNKKILYEMLNRPIRQEKTSNYSLENILEKLDILGYTYEYKKIKYELSQYFNDCNEMLDYFTNRYNIQTDREVEITEEFIRKFTTKVDDEYKFENIKESWFITIKGK